MDYENEYKAALGRARNLHKDAIDMEDSLRAKMAEIIFPELRESKDERIIKEITFFLKQKGGYNKEWIDWLENLAPTPQGKSALDAIKEENKQLIRL